jgi:hypothetical protein
MTEKQTHTKKASSPSSGGEAFPKRIPRGGSLIHHDRPLTAEERSAREARREKREADELKEQEEHREAGAPDGSFAARRQER